MVKEQLNVEQPKIKEEKPQHELELEREPLPKEGESLDIWLNRIGGPYAEVGGILKIYPIRELSEKEKESEPLRISRKGDFILNDKNLGKYFNVESISKLLEEKNPNIKFVKRRNEYQIKKDLFETPTDYFDVIAKVFKKEEHISADKAFAKNVKKWAEEEEKAPPVFEEEFDEEDFSDLEESEKEEVKKEPEKKEEKKVKEEKKPETEKKPEAEKKPLTLDEKIKQKEGELEKVEQNYNIYYSPVVRDLLGLYYKSEFKSLKKEVKKLKKAREKVGGEAAAKGVEVESSFAEATEDKKPIAKEYLKHIKYTNKLFIEMVKVRGGVKKGEADPSEYEEIKSEWRTAYKKTGEMYDGLSEEDQEKTIKKREKEMKRSKKGKSLLKKKWKELWKLVIKKFEKETIDEVTRDAMEEEIEVIKERLKKIPQEIKKSGVLEQTKLEDEQKRLEKHLKKFK